MQTLSVNDPLMACSHERELETDGLLDTQWE